MGVSTRVACRGAAQVCLEITPKPFLHDYLSMVNFQHLVPDAAQCLRHSTPQSPEVASPVIRAHGAQTFRRVQKVDVQPGQPACA